MEAALNLKWRRNWDQIFKKVNTTRFLVNLDGAVGSGEHNRAGREVEAQELASIGCQEVLGSCNQ